MIYLLTTLLYEISVSSSGEKVLTVHVKLYELLYNPKVELVKSKPNGIPENNRIISFHKKEEKNPKKISMYQIILLCVFFLQRSS